MNSTNRINEFLSKILERQDKELEDIITQNWKYFMKEDITIHNSKFKNNIPY